MRENHLFWFTVIFSLSNDGCADKVAGGEVIDKGGTFVEYHVETQSVVAFLILIQYEFIVFVNHDRG